MGQKRSLIIADAGKRFPDMVAIINPMYGNCKWCGVIPIRGKYVCLAERDQKRRISRAAIIHTSLCPELAKLGCGEFERSFPEPDSFGMKVDPVGEADVVNSCLGFYLFKPDMDVVGRGKDVCVDDSGFSVYTGFEDGTRLVTGLTDLRGWEAVFVDFTKKVG